MIRERKQMLRLALAIREQYADRTEPPVTLPIAEWRELCAKVRRNQRARMRGLPLAAVKLKEESVLCLQRLRDRILTALAAEADLEISRIVPSAGEIYRDLTALHDEFDEVSWSLAGGTLSVTTEPIVLEGIHLGRFTIELQWAQLPTDCVYSVFAEDPRPAASNESVTHPHVEENVLCAGDGRAAIRCALTEGRLTDFFLIVANILRTYNHDSAYVTLELWQGRRCMDCGTHTGEDESVSCTRCDRSVCNDCYVYCESCHSTYCSDCSSQCAGCIERYCNDCLHTCPACQEWVCSNCLTEKDCECCHEEETEDESPEQDAANHSSSASAAIQPDCVGQAVVPA
jgi:hypothetical protein